VIPKLPLKPICILRRNKNIVSNIKPLVVIKKMKNVFYLLTYFICPLGWVVQ
jgi:hypothetical protein